jgi:hypothetical protein
MCDSPLADLKRSAGAPEEKREIPEITMGMLHAGVNALRDFDPEEEEDDALVAAIYWAMDAAKPY